MGIFSLLSFFAFLVYLYLGLKVFRADQHYRLNQLFLVFCICLAIWSFGYTFVYNTFDGSTVEFWLWNKIAAIGWCTYSGVAVHISLLLAGKEKILRRPATYGLIYAPAITALSVEVLVFGPTYHPISANNLFVLFHGIYYVGCLTTSLMLIWFWGRKSSLRREKKQARIIVLTGLISFGSGFITQTVLPIVGVPMVPIAQIITLVWAYGMYLSITKYKFMQVTSLVDKQQILGEITDLLVLANRNQHIVWVNNRVIEILNWQSADLLDRPLKNFVLEKEWLTEILTPLSTSDITHRQTELHLLSQGGERIPVNANTTTVTDVMGDCVGVLFVIQDMRVIKRLEVEINEKLKTEQVLKYLSHHDSLTGLCNRAYFEQEMEHFNKRDAGQIGLILSDVDGLKLINDTLGHAAGDQLIIAASQAMVAAVGSNGMVSRIGGDEFAVLVTGTEEFVQTIGQEICKEIQSGVVAFNTENTTFSLSMSVGWAIVQNDQTVQEVFKAADDNMYREKLHKSQSTRSAIIRTLTETLQTRDYIIEGHAVRLERWVKALGRAANLHESCFGDLCLFAQFHDLGKVGVPDRILFKAGTLTTDERKEIQRHSEIGYRIAVSSPELLPIADWILKHHEWWNGLGYPIGLKGEDIPLECRVLSIVDAFDAMTNDRPYRLAMSQNEALTELKIGAGTQFDPVLVKLFSTIVQV